MIYELICTLTLPGAANAYAGLRQKNTIVYNTAATSAGGTGALDITYRMEKVSNILRLHYYNVGNILLLCSPGLD